MTQTTEPVTDWRTLHDDQRIVVLADVQSFRWQDEEGTITRVEPCQAPDSAWVYVRVDGSRTGVDEPFLLIDGHPPRLAVQTVTGGET